MEILEYGEESAAAVLLQPVDEHDLETIENEIALIRAEFSEPFRLLAFRIHDWNRELSPWKAPAVFGREDFGDGAEDTLREILSLCADEDQAFYLGGYSLAGLFALWAAYRTDRFRGIAAASPSVWFPGFSEYMRERRIRCRHVYLSLGDREEKTRNPVMATVGDQIRGADQLLRAQGIDCTLEWNEGNHFMDADKRTAKAFLWVLKRSRLAGEAKPAVF